MPPHIMAFDREVNHLVLYNSLLGSHGYIVLCYNHEWLDFEMIELIQPELIIWGYVYGFNNRELDVVEEIRNHPQTQDVPVLLTTTASKLFLDIRRLQALRNLYMLDKPFSAEQLLRVVQLALGSSRPNNTAPASDMVE